MKPLNTVFIVLLATAILLGITIDLLPEEVPLEEKSKTTRIALIEEDDSPRKNKFTLENEEYYQWYLFSRSRRERMIENSAEKAYERMYTLFPEGSRMGVEDEMALEYLRIYER